jgi:hypothetical protein
MRVDALAEQAKSRGTNVLSGPTDQPWNVRELTILDPDGYKLVFTAPLNPKLEFEEVLKGAASGR